ncbi:GlxA family transcriptional regulator [Streptomyces sp. BI20]|uniref:GlxA family transcriptional regulator n=1 Tax=Streptomyces sp. BI20 TaxID=3403460 RepID=UPI003C77A810
MDTPPESTPAPPPDAPRPHHVVVLALRGALPLELGIAHRVFGRARDAAGRPLYTVETCGLAAGEVETDADFTIGVPSGPEALARADTVIVPASRESDHLAPDGTPSAELAAALARVRPGTRYASICTGAAVLAAVGLLDGRRATTHWAHAEAFRARFPAVRLDADVLYVDEGDVLTSAGVAAGLDLCLHMVRRDHGAAVANDVARRTVVPPHREGGQAQFALRPVAGEGRVAGTAAARAWAMDRIDRPLSLAELARREGVSVRTLTRRFREEAGTSPGQWLTGQRVDRARHLLETTDWPMERVAREAGFGTAQSLRKHLTAVLGVPPTAYRRTFRAGAPTPSTP